MQLLEPQGAVLALELRHFGADVVRSGLVLGAKCARDVLVTEALLVELSESVDRHVGREELGPPRVEARTRRGGTDQAEGAQQKVDPLPAPSWGGGSTFEMT
jgi:hypothetical protein